MTNNHTISLRPALLSDVTAMAAIELAAFSDPWPASSFADMLPMTHARVVVAVDADTKLVGYCILISAADEGEIANIAVRPSQRRRGIGALLLDDALAEAARTGVIQLFLEVRASNAAAGALYASRGFLPVGRRIAYYHAPVEDALVLRRRAGN